MLTSIELLEYIDDCIFQTLILTARFSFMASARAVSAGTVELRMVSETALAIASTVAGLILLA